tara:strand:+ start:571 stop:834 length:264 start_codon:yes stop_codon:yes gene_type:complete
MKSLKFKLLIPVVAIIFAVTSAFTTSASTNVDAFSIPGYIDSPVPCQQPISCQVSGTQLCTNGLFGPQVYGKNDPNDTTCPRVVYKN